MILNLSVKITKYKPSIHRHHHQSDLPVLYVLELIVDRGYGRWVRGKCPRGGLYVTRISPAISTNSEVDIVKARTR